MSQASEGVIVGVDVGGTNTDAVVVCRGQVLAQHKTNTTDDVTSGILEAMECALRNGD